MILYKNSNLPSLLITLGAILTLLEYMFDCFSDNETLTSFYIIQLFALFFLSYYFTVKKLGFLHLFSLLHITTFIFAFGGIIATPFLEFVDFRVSYSPLYIRFPEPIVQKVILIYTIYIAFTYLFFFFFHQRIKWNKDNNYKEAKETKHSYMQLGKIIMLILFPFAILYSYTILNLFFNNRALMYQMGSLAISGVPFYLRITNLFFTTGFFLLIASIPPKKIFVKYSVIYLISLVPLLMMGERGQIVAAIIFMLWYMNKMYQIKINILKLFILALIIMVVSYIITFTRQGESVNSMSLSFLLLGFLGSSATSFSLLAYYIIFKDQMVPHNYPFFLDSFIGGLTGATGQSLETLEVRSSIGHHLIYTLNPSYYLSGASKGTSSITEFFEFGIVGVIFGALLLAVFMNFVERKMFQSHFRMIFLYVFFQMIILSARGSLLPSLYDIFKYTLIFLLLISIYKVLKPIKK